MRVLEGLHSVLGLHLKVPSRPQITAFILWGHFYYIEYAGKLIYCEKGCFGLHFHGLRGRGLHRHVQYRFQITFLVRLRQSCFINFVVELLSGLAAHQALLPDDFKASGTPA